MCWQIMDAVTQSMYVDYGYNAFETFRANNLGFTSLMAAPNLAIKTLGALGSMRTIGIVMATVISGILIKFGGAALASMAGNLTGQIQSQGASAAMKTETPEGHASELRQTWDVMPTEAWANHHKWDNIAQTKIGAAEYGYSQQAAQADMHQKYGDGIRDSQGWQMDSGILSSQKERTLYGNAEKMVDAKYAGLEGNIRGAGGLDNYIEQVKARGEGDTASELEAAKLRSSITGEDTKTALIQNKVDGARWQVVQNTSHGEAIDTYGAEAIERTTWQAEGKKIGDTNAAALLGGAAGYDMTTAAGVVGFSENQKLSTGREANFQLTGDRREHFQKLLDDAGIKGINLRDGDMVGGLRMGDNGKPAEFSIVGNGRRIDFNGSTLTEKSTSDGMAFTKVEDKEGNVISSFGEKISHDPMKIGNYNVQSGATVKKYDDGRLEVGGIINGKRGSLTYDAQSNKVVYADGTSGHSFVDKDVDYKDVQKGLRFGIGTQGWQGTQNRTYNEDSFSGAYRGNDGNLYYGNLQYGRNSSGERVIVSGQGTDIVQYKYADTEKTPDGKTVYAERDATYGPNNASLHTSGITGNNFKFDDSKSFSGGYKYDNYVSATLDEHGFHRTAQAAGRVQGIIIDMERYIPKGSLFKGSRSPGSGDINPNAEGPYSKYPMDYGKPVPPSFPKMPMTKMR